ncbi:hypothetical protein OAN24_04435 [Pseudodesulfovibrio sp.]|nr:hypothetical protein [Pseudodesulfovibrio sp.]
MSNKCQGADCGPVKGFSTAEKIFAQGSFYAAVIIGAYVMAVQSPLLALGYVVFTIGGFTLLMRYTVCARCPHLLDAKDCLFVPASLAINLISKQHTGPLSGWEKFIVFSAPLGTIFIPVYWLLPSPVLLACFLLFSGACVFGLRLHFCKECQTIVCPMNPRY